MAAFDSSDNRNCPACDSEVGLSRGRKNAIQMLSCQNCGTLYTSSFPGLQNTHDYDTYYGANNLSAPDFVHKRLDDIVAGFSKYRQLNRLLDVGCGAGLFIQAAARAGWNTEGVEISQSAVEHLRGLGLNVFHGDLSQAGYAEGYFDVVVASELLEHVPEPRGLIQEIARVLRPGGLFWATTPHAKGISARILGMKWSVISPPEHLQLFSLKGMRSLLSSAGFHRLRLLTRGTNPFEILHTLRPHPGNGGTDNGDGFNRVTSSYQLNEFLSEGFLRRGLKGSLNWLLGISRTGDSLKFEVEK